MGGTVKTVMNKTFVYIPVFKLTNTCSKPDFSLASFTWSNVKPKGNPDSTALNPASLAKAYLSNMDDASVNINDKFAQNFIFYFQNNLKLEVILF